MMSGHEIFAEVAATPSLPAELALAPGDPSIVDNYVRRSAPAHHVYGLFILT